MVKATVHPEAPKPADGKTAEAPKTGMSPSEELIAAATKTVTVFDAMKRPIVLQKPSVIQQFKLVEVVGAERAKNEVWMGMVNPLTFVKKIEADDIYPPANMNELEALMQRLDDHGIEAVQMGVVNNWGSPEQIKALADALKK